MDVSLIFGRRRVVRAENGSRRRADALAGSSGGRMDSAARFAALQQKLCDASTCPSAAKIR
jgi:phage terminase large subunit-like protein